MHPFHSAVYINVYIYHTHSAYAVRITNRMAFAIYQWIQVLVFLFWGWQWWQLRDTDNTNNNIRIQWKKCGFNWIKKSFRCCRVNVCSTCTVCSHVISQLCCVRFFFVHFILLIVRRSFSSFLCFLVHSFLFLFSKCKFHSNFIPFAVFHLDTDNFAGGFSQWKKWTKCNIMNQNESKWIKKFEIKKNHIKNFCGKSFAVMKSFFLNWN